MGQKLVRYRLQAEELEVCGGTQRGAVHQRLGPSLPAPPLPACLHHGHAAPRRGAPHPDPHPQVLSELGLGGGNPRKSPGDGVAVNEDLLVEVCRAGAGEDGLRGCRERGR